MTKTEVQISQNKNNKERCCNKDESKNVDNNNQCNQKKGQPQEDDDDMRNCAMCRDKNNGAKSIQKTKEQV